MGYNVGLLMKTGKVIGTLLIKVLTAFTAYRVTVYVIKITQSF